METFSMTRSNAEKAKTEILLKVSPQDSSYSTPTELYKEFEPGQPEDAEDPTLTNSYQKPFDDINSDSKSENLEQPEFGSTEILPTDLIGIPVSHLISGPFVQSSQSDVFAQGPSESESTTHSSLRQRKRNSLPSIDALADQSHIIARTSLPFLNLPKKTLKLPSALRSSKKKVINKDPNEEEGEDQPLIRKQKRFSIFSLSRH